MSLSVRRSGRSVLTFAALFAAFLGAAAYAQETEKPGIAVYVAGDVPANEKKVLGTYLLNAVVKAGCNQIGEEKCLTARCGWRTVVKAGCGQISEEADAFLAAVTADEHAKGGAILSKARVCELGRQFNIRYICAATVTQAFDFYVISTRMVDTETEEIVLKGEAPSPLKTIDDLTQVSNKLVESMFGVNIADTQTAAAPVPTQTAKSATDASSVTPAVTPTAAVSVTGDAKIAVDMVVTAVNAFKDATAKSIDAANAVKTAAQSKNYSAIMDAKKKVTNATETLKKAKADVTAAINTLNSAGPEAQAAVKAMGIDLSMFGGSAGSADNADGGGEDGEGGDGEGTSFYFTPKYQSPVGTPVSWGGVNAEIGWVWRNGAVFGIDLSFGMDGVGSLMGLGLSLGKEYDFRHQMQAVYGMAAGFWMVGGRYGESYNFLAPFVKYRVSDYEVTYRGLMGINQYTDKFSYNSHQTMVGYQFRGAPNKPKRSDPRPSDDEERKTAAARKTKNGFSLGYVLSGDANTNIFQVGFAQSRPIGGTGLSFGWESNLLGGWGHAYNYIWDYYDPIKSTEIFGAVGLNVPLLAQFEWSVLSVESGAAFDLLYRIGGDDYYGKIYDETIFNAGFVVGGGLSLGPCRLSYRFNTGTRYYSQTVGVRFLF